MIGVDVIVTGSLTNVAFSEGIGGKFGPFNFRKSYVKVVMTIRLIDVQTGEILYSAIKEEKASKSSVSGVLPIPIPGGIGFSKQEAVDIMTAIQLICSQVALDFTSKIDQKNIAVSSAPLEGYVVKVKSTSSGTIIQVYINLGKNSGICVGDEIRIYREGEVILDPKTNEVLDRELDLIAKARVMEVKDKTSITLITKKFTSSDILLEDIVEVVR